MTRSELIAELAGANAHLEGRDIERIVSTIFDRDLRGAGPRRARGTARVRRVHHQAPRRARPGAIRARAPQVRVESQDSFRSSRRARSSANGSTGARHHVRHPRLRHPRLRHPRVRPLRVRAEAAHPQKGADCHASPSSSPLPLIVVLVIFALSNRADVTLSFIGYATILPLSVAVLIAAGVFFLLRRAGGLVRRAAPAPTGPAGGTARRGARGTARGRASRRRRGQRQRADDRDAGARRRRGRDAARLSEAAPAR